jgi:hypothetical protein
MNPNKMKELTKYQVNNYISKHFEFNKKGELIKGTKIHLDNIINIWTKRFVCNKPNKPKQLKLWD